MPRPARDFEEAEARFAALCRLDENPLIAVWGRSRAFLQQRKTRLAVVFVHGFTNSPQQFVPLAETLSGRGHNVIVPRLPGHGAVDRIGRRLAAGARVETWLASLEESVDIASGLGERVAIAGISAGGSLAAWFALGRRAVAHAVGIAPMFGILRLPPPLQEALVPALLTLPDGLIRWDPFGDGRQIPDHAYPRFATHGLAQCLRVGLDVYERSREMPHSLVTLILNERDPAVNNAMALEIGNRWSSAGAEAITLRNLPGIHDIIDPVNPYQRTDLVYPRLIEALES